MKYWFPVLTSDPSSQPQHVTRSSSPPRKRLGSTRTMLCSYPTVPKEDSTRRSNVTPPPATAGVCWWTLDGPYLGPPPGGRDLTYGTFTLIYTHSFIAWFFVTDKPDSCYTGKRSSANQTQKNGQLRRPG